MDSLSQLPDDILIHIWSFLTTEEAFGIRLLSKHWRRHWLLYVDTLDLNSCSFITNPRDLISTALPINPNLPALKRKFYRWLKVVGQDRDRVRDLVEGVPLGKLRIQSPTILRRGWFNQIDEWISYAFARKVRSLELDFSFYMYRFPKGLNIAETLASLSLSSVILSPEDIDSFFTKCPLLQHIKFSDLWFSSGIQITSSSLKHLEVSCCFGLKHVIVRNTCLVSLTLTRLDHLFLENNPDLVSVCVTGHTCYSSALGQLESCLSRLQVLTLSLGVAQVYDEVPILKELKHLTLLAAPVFGDCIARLTPLLNICPNIEKLVLDLIWPKSNAEMEYEKGPKVPLRHLKDIEVRGYWGEEPEDEVIKHVLEHVSGPLERILFDPHTLGEDSFQPFTTVNNKSDQMRAELLKRVIPSSLEFIVL